MPPNFAAQRSTTLQHARAIVDRAKSANRELTAAEQAEVESDVATIHELDRKLRGVAVVKSVLELGNYDRDFDPDTDGGTRYLSFRTARVKSDMTARFGSRLGLKALVEDGSPVVSVPLDAQPYGQSEPPTSLLEVIPAVIRPVTYRYMRQTTRNNAAAPVAPGAPKPTSTYGLVSVEGGSVWWHTSRNRWPSTTCGTPRAWPSSSRTRWWPGSTPPWRTRSSPVMVSART